MKTIIGYTDSVTECECCGKNNLKGTFCLDVDGVERYYGSTCTFKKHIENSEEKSKVMSTVRFAEKQAVINCRRKNDLNLANYDTEFKKVLSQYNLLKS